MAAAELPEGLEEGRHLTLPRPDLGAWARAALLLTLAAIAALALANAFGQRSSTTTTAAPAATLTVTAPDRVRGGLLYQTRFTIVAHMPVERLHLVLSPGWADGVTLNTLEPSPGQEGSRNGRLSLSYGTLDPGQRLDVFGDWQVNPTTVDSRDVYADVYDGGQLLVRVHRKFTLLP